MDQHEDVDCIPQSTIQAILEFLNLTKLDDTVVDISSLSDGVALFNLLSQIAPLHFDNSTITLSVQDNWPLKLSNLKKLSSNLHDYYSSVLEQQFTSSENSNVDLTKLAKQNTTSEIVKLVEQVMGCAVQCEDRDMYIGFIMTLTTESQAVMKEMIEKVMQSVESTSKVHDRDDDLRRRLSSADMAEESEISFGDDFTTGMGMGMDQSGMNDLNKKLEKLAKEKDVVEFQKIELQEKLFACQQVSERSERAFGT